MSYPELLAQVDFCRVAVEQAGESAWNLTPETLRGMVFVDEIDLHLHARMQRTIVHRLREALPKIQWVVTTHSPLVLTAFSHEELRVLDRSHPDRIWVPDRPVYGFTIDEITEYLLHTEPESAPYQEMLQDNARQGAAAPRN